MSLITFHRGLIIVAIVFCLGFGAWELSGAFDVTEERSVVLGVTFVLLGIGLAIYLARLSHFLGLGELGDARENP